MAVVVVTCINTVRLSTAYCLAFCVQMILEYCERGSLDRAVSAGRFVRRDNQQPEMVSILLCQLQLDLI